ncbi:MAG: integron integrase [Gemmatimonadota bacterium]
MGSTPQVERLVEGADRVMRVRNYSPRTRDTYRSWIRRFLVWSNRRNLHDLGRPDVELFVSHLARRDHVGPKTRNQAVSALAFFFREILGRDELGTLPRAKEPKRIPVVLSHRQVMLVLAELSGKYRLIAGLMYGAGLRLSEAHRLRVKDVDLDLMQISVVDGKGAKDRWVILPERLVPALNRQIDEVRVRHDQDQRRGAGWARLPNALARKDPGAGYSLGQQFLFPASRESSDPFTGRKGRAYLSHTATQREVKRAGIASGIPKPISCHTFRRSFATQMLRSGYDVRTVQKLMGHNDVRTTMIYVEAVTDAGTAMRSPLDQRKPRD